MSMKPHSRQVRPARDDRRLEPAKGGSAARARVWTRPCSGMAFLCLVAGCVRVPAYERGQLAHPSMESTLGESAAQAHLYAIQEGALGGHLGSGSGCGCN
jgi:hypothetical protein